MDMNHIFRVVLIGLALIAPFIALEAVTTSFFSRSGFPATLFFSMWVNASIVVASMLSVFKKIQGDVRRSLVPFAAVATIFILSTAALVTIIIDQMPCFLGGTGC